MGIFKAYDIRGIYDRDWNKDTAYRIGLHLPELLGTDNIIVGRDARISSKEIFEALSSGITEAGCDVTDIGLCSTPSCYFATAFYGASGSVMITASHNPKEYNGLKISRKNAVPVGYETGLDKLEEMVTRNEKPHSVGAGRRGSIKKLDIREDYLNHIAKFKDDISGIDAVIDCSDGVAGVFIHDILGDTGAKIRFLYDKPDGNFPHHEPNPLIESNLADLKAAVRADNAEIGICFDGDADRVMFIDETGNFVSPDLITALLGYHFFIHFPEKPGKDKTVLYDVRSSRSVPEFITELGGNPVMCKVGHSHAKKLLRETNGIYGGELAGHYYFRENFYCDSGMIAALTVLSVLKRERKSLSELMGRIKKYHYSGEINFEVKDKEGILEALKRDYREGKLNTLDGIRIDFPTWWFNARPSNTEPYLRLVVEAETADELNRRVDELKEKISTLAE